MFGELKYIPNRKELMRQYRKERAIKQAIPSSIMMILYGVLTAAMILFFP